MQLNRIDDPRDWISKARARELVEIAHAQGHHDITEAMPADDYTEPDGKLMPGIRTMLRQRGVKRVPTPQRPLGKAGRHETQPIIAKAQPAAAPADPDWAEFQQWKAWKASQQQAAPAEPAPKPKRLVERPVQEINTLRDYCKANGIKMDRRDNKASLKAKVEAHKAEHGEQDAPQRLQ